MVDYLSLTSILIEPCFNETKLGSATGFIIENNNQCYLVTNWHVVTGINPLTDKPIHSQSSLPNSLIIWHHIKSIQPNTIDWFSIKVPLYKSDEINYEERNWIEHAKGKQVDVILLPLNPTPAMIRIDIHQTHLQIHNFDMKLASIDMIPIPAMPVSIIGFPLGRSAGGVLPIWVTGFIASEPTIDIDGIPLFYVNASGRSGLSGAPVVLRLSGGYATSDGKSILSSSGYQTKFMGIYSGRICEGTDVCRVWKPIVLDQIIESIEKYEK